MHCQQRYSYFQNLLYFNIVFFLTRADQQATEADNQLVTPSRSEWPFKRNDVLDLPKAIVNPQVKTNVDAGKSFFPVKPLVDYLSKSLKWRIPESIIHVFSSWPSQVSTLEHCYNMGGWSGDSGQSSNKEENTNQSVSCPTTQVSFI